MKNLFLSFLISIVLFNTSAFAFSSEISEVAKQKTEQAFKELTNLEKITENNSLKVAYLYTNLGKIDKSIELASKILEKEPNNSSALFLIGENYKRKYNFSIAKEYFEKITNNSPEYEKSLFKLMEIAISLDDEEQAKKIIEDAKKFPKIEKFISGLYYYSSFKMEPDKALELFETALKDNPNDEDILYYYAYNLLNKDKRKEAKEIFYKILDINFFNSQTHSILAFIEFLDGNFDTSVKESKMALNINPYNLRAYINLGNGMSNKTYTKLEGKNKNLVSSDEFFDTGKKAYLLFNQNKKEDALELINKLVIKYPNNIHSYIQLGAFLLLIGDYENSLKAYNKALSISEDYGVANNGISNVLKNYIKSQQKNLKSLNLDIYDYSLIDKESLVKVFVNYESLPEKSQKALLYSVFLLKKYIPLLAKKGATHYIVPLYEKLTDHEKASYLKDQRSGDGRLWDDIRGMGGFDSATGIEDLNDSIYFDFNTLTHELTHQVHGNVISDEQVEKIKELYEKAKNRGSFLDYYSSTNEFEYFAQAVEAYAGIQGKKNNKSTAKNTPELLKKVDPEMYDFVVKFVE